MSLVTEMAVLVPKSAVNARNSKLASPWTGS